MKKLIMIPGNIDNIFFLNELKFLKETFDEIYILGYKIGKKRKVKQLDKYNLKYDFVNNITLYSLIISVINILLVKDFRVELLKCKPYSIKGLKKAIYALVYENFFINAQFKLLKNNMKDSNKELYLYSYWLSRGAYAIARSSKYLKGNKIRAFSRAHGYDLYEERNELNYLPFRAYINNNLSSIYFISMNGREYFEEKYKFFNCEKYYISRLGTYNNGYKKKIIDKNYICIASCSSIIQIKRLDLIINVLKHLKVPFKWIHIGEGNLENEIMKYAEKTLDKAQFQFLGNIDNRMILKKYIEYDVDYFINMSDSEGIPVSIMEAISIGIPVIARNVGGVKEIVDNNMGLLLDKIEISKINKFIYERLKNENEYRKQSLLCRKKWEQFYNAENNYKRFINDMLDITI